MTPRKAAFFGFVLPASPQQQSQYSVGKLEPVRGNGLEGLMDVITFSSYCCSFGIPASLQHPFSPLRTRVLSDSRPFFRMKSSWNRLLHPLPLTSRRWSANQQPWRPCVFVCFHRPAVLSTATCAGSSSTSPAFAPTSAPLSRSSTPWPRLCKVGRIPGAERDAHRQLIWDDGLFSGN